jgi:molecular chaperone HscA
MVAGAARIRVTYQVDADGLLQVSARETSSGAEASVAVKPSYGLADGDIERMLRESVDHAREDVHARALAENRVEGQRLIEATLSAIKADASLLDADERASIDKAMRDLESSLAGKDHRAIKKGMDALNKATEAFAARRMDAGVRKALAGRKIGSL